MSQHLKDFARHLVDEREGAPVAIATVVAVFVNLGNPLPGKDRDEQLRNARAILADDDGLVLDGQADTIDTPNEGESADEFKARRARGVVKH